jgi:hypothetical protein
MYSNCRSIIVILILLDHLLIQTVSNSLGTVSNQDGRISNIPNDYIYVSTALSEADCVRQCVDFRKNHYEYVYEDCYAYNYHNDQFTCELIHSIEPLDYTISIRSRWKAGVKY